MKHWLDALATPGGNLFILIFMVLLLLLLMAEPGMFKYSDDVDKVIQTMFAGFSGALLQALTSGTRFVSTAPAVETQALAKTEVTGDSQSTASLPQSPREQ
jgi:hypothetical protein